MSGKDKTPGGGRDTTPGVRTVSFFFVCCLLINKLTEGFVGKDVSSAFNAGSMKSARGRGWGKGRGGGVYYATFCVTVDTECHRP